MAFEALLYRKNPLYQHHRAAALRACCFATFQRASTCMTVCEPRACTPERLCEWQPYLIHDVSGEVSIAEGDDAVLDQAATFVEVLA